MTKRGEDTYFEQFTLVTFCCFYPRDKNFCTLVTHFCMTPRDIMPFTLVTLYPHPLKTTSTPRDTFLLPPVTHFCDPLVTTYPPSPPQWTRIIPIKSILNIIKYPFNRLHTFFILFIELCCAVFIYDEVFLAVYHKKRSAETSPKPLLFLSVPCLWARSIARL